MTLRSLVVSSRSIDGQLSAVRKAYTAGNIPNTVPDGTVSFPSDPEKIKAGIELEFRCALSNSTPVSRYADARHRDVSFKYPDADKYALKNISFKLLPGQLCVCNSSIVMHFLTEDASLGDSREEWRREKHHIEAHRTPI